MANLDTIFSKIVFASYDNHDLRTSRRRGMEGLVIFSLILGVAILVYKTGGLTYVYSHAMYVPVVLAGLRLGIASGIAAGVVAGLALGTAMPLHVSAGLYQHTHAWLYRMFLLILVGGLTGVLVKVEDTERNLLHEMMDSMSRTCARTLKSFAQAIEAKDQQTKGHSDRVAYNTQIVGSYLKLPSKGITELFWAGLLHDLGKIGVPDCILLKNGKLDPEETEAIRKHAGRGHEMLSHISPVFNKIALGIRSHHGIWDGKGYPDGLKGRNIPLFGRILAVADVYEALTVRRPYRDPLPEENAFEYICEGAGSMFDPRVVQGFVAARKAGKICTAQVDDSIAYDLPDQLGLDVIYRGYVAGGKGFQKFIIGRAAK